MTEIARIVLARRPVGMPSPADFRIEPMAMPEPGPGEIVIANRVLSMDPAIRGFIDDRPSYLPPVAIGDTVRGMTLGGVVRSREPTLPEGAIVRTLAGWATHSVLTRTALGLEELSPAPGIALETYMGALGPAGLTAWVGLHEIGRIRPGETILVSAAAGAVGNVVCQLAKAQGCTVIGLAGAGAKCDRLRALGVDATIDYRATPDLAAAIDAAAPDGIHVYFDNVGGATLEAAMRRMREQGRIVVCGMIGDYNGQDDPYPVRTLWQMVTKRLTMRGFLTYDHADRLAEASAALTAAVADGTLVPIETVHDGLAQAPHAFIAMMQGATIGKTLVRLP